MSHSKKSWLAPFRNIVSRSPRREKLRRTRPEVELLEDRRLLAVLRVTVTGDSGDDAAPLANSLRAELIAAKAGDTIVFAIGNMPEKVLVKAHPLPPITKPITIDGTPTAGNAAQTIELTPDSTAVPTGAGLTFQSGADSSKVFGLTIDGFQGDGILLSRVGSVQIGAADGTTIGTTTVANGQGRMFIYGNGTENSSANGIEITGIGAKGNSVVASFIGTNAAQTSQVSKYQSAGIAINDHASGNYIGPGSLSASTVAAGANVISGNHGSGVSIIDGSGNVIAGNYIGTKEDGTSKLGNGGFGVVIPAGDGNTVGSATTIVKGVIATPANIISGNIGSGISLGATGSRIWGDFIGVDKTGVTGLGNGGSGISVPASSENTFIGGAQPGLGNVIADNGSDGITFVKDRFTGAEPHDVTVQHNWIGFGKDGKTKIPNTGNGLDFVSGGFHNLHKDNTIYAKAGKKDVNDPNKENKTVDPNSIFNDTSGGIDIGSPGDSGDSAPVLTSAVVSGTTTVVQGSLQGTPDATFVLEFFGNSAASPTGYGPGEFFLGNTTVTTNDQGSASFSVTLGAVYGSYVSATATGTADNGYTSEFSRDIALSGASSSAAVGGFVWNDANGNGLQNSGEGGVSGVSVSLVPNAGGTTLTTTTDSTGHYLFSGVAPGDYYLQFTSPTGDAFTQPYQGNGMNDSHASPVDGTTEVITLTAGEYDPYLGAGVLALTLGPSVSILPAGSVNAGDTLVTEGWFAEPGGAPWTATVDYGDGSGAQPLSLNTDKTFDLSHTYTTSGSYTVTVNVTDNNNQVGSATLPMQVLTAAPTVTLGDDTSIPTGTTFTQGGSFSDPYSTSWTATVDYGDGGGAQPLTLNADHTFSLSHTYSTAGT